MNDPQTQSESKIEQLEKALKRSRAANKRLKAKYEQLWDNFRDMLGPIQKGTQ